VNSNALAKLYDRLNPRERLPLIMAASLREDEAERQRLAMSAPKACFQVPDHFGLAMAFREVSDHQFMELLHLAALHAEGMGLADALGDKQGTRMFDVALLFGYLFKVQLAGWRQFCAELQVDPEQLWSCLPGFTTVKHAEHKTETAAFTAEGADAYLRRAGRENARSPTAEDVAAGLRASLKARAEWWDG
jgi:hypothetical protein